MLTSLEKHRETKFWSRQFVIQSRVQPQFDRAALFASIKTSASVALLAVRQEELLKMAGHNPHQPDCMCQELEKRVPVLVTPGCGCEGLGKKSTVSRMCFVLVPENCVQWSKRNLLLGRWTVCRGQKDSFCREVRVANAWKTENISGLEGLSDNVKWNTRKSMLSPVWKW